MRKIVSFTLAWTATVLATTFAHAQPVPVKYDANGVDITAEFHPPSGGPGPMAILLHDMGSDRGSWSGLIPTLQRDGFAILNIDMRGHGDSPGPADKGLPDRAARGDRRLLSSMYRDVAGAFEWLGARDDVDMSRLVLIGAGTGGFVALDYAARDRSVDAIVMLSPEREKMLDPLKPLDKFGDRPLLIIATSDKPAIELRDTAEHAEVKVAEGPGYGTALLGTGIERDITDYAKLRAGETSAEIVCASLKSDVFHATDSPSAKRIKAHHKRLFSSPQEARGRGLRPAGGDPGKS
jgi:pimeloyl-ACP methyl ester carboxylesterase